MAHPSNVSTAPGGTGSAPRRHRILLISLVVIAALVAALIAGEFYARHTVKSCMSQQFKDELGSNVDVGLGPKPMLISLLDKSVPYVVIDSDDTAFGPAKDMKVHARVDDIRLDQTPQSSGTVGSSAADIDWSTSGIEQTLQTQSFGGLVTGVHSNGGAGTLTFDVGPAGLAQLTVKPLIQGPTVEVQTVDAQILGLGIPTDLVDGIVKVVGDSLQSYPLGMTPSSLKVTDTGVQMSLRGGQYTMPPNSAEQSSTCGVLS